jgi:hypothetical protein
MVSPSRTLITWPAKSCFWHEHSHSKGYGKPTTMDHGCFSGILADRDVWACSFRRFFRRRSSHHAITENKTKEPGTKKTNK